MNNKKSTEDLSLFKFGGQLVRMAGTWDAPKFCANDAIAALYPDIDKRNRVNLLKRVPKHQRGHMFVMTLGGKQKVVSLTEGGLYRLILKSESPLAEKFQDWVTDEVLPTIRKTGAYHRVKVVPDDSGDRTQVSRILAAKRRIKAKVNALAGHALLSDEMTVFGRIYNAAALVLWGKPISSVMRELGLTELGYEYPSEWWRYLDSYNQAAWADVLSQVPDWTDDLFSSHRKIRELGESWISAGGTTQPIIMRGKVKTSGPHQSAWLFEGGVA
jgi:prophage antirepressor-like protein